jgi:hypothetical protein
MTMFANFPYEIVDTSGESALATWEALKNAGRGAPVVLGSDLENLLAPFDPNGWRPTKSIEEILAAADTISFPDGLYQLRKDERFPGVAALQNIASWNDFDEEDESELPAETSPSPGLSVAFDILTGEPRSTVHIALIPTDDPTAIPAYMQWGCWNECPPAAYHVAALRAWRDRYGAELVGLGGDVINLRVLRKPATPKEALKLAHVQYVYCSDIISQGYGSHRALAGALMGDDWWYFWWD